MADKRINARDNGWVERLDLLREPDHVLRQKTQKRFDYRIAVSATTSIRPGAIT